MSALIGVAAPVAHRGIVDAHAAIDARTGERKAERSGHRRFGITGIGRAVACRVTPHGAPCAIGGRIFAQARGRDEKERGEARRRQVDEIVEPGGGPAEGLVAGRAMADHTVGGVDRLVECGARESGNGHPEDRRDHRIGEILGEALDRRAGDAGAHRAPRYRGRRCATLRCGRLRCLVSPAQRRHPPRAGAGFFARSACWRGGQRRGDRREGAEARARRSSATAPTTTIRISTATMPAARRARAPIVSRLSNRSSAPIKRPIQVTGWPIARATRSG